ncbi:hypothetical protein K2Z84_17735, partial [Candidatus Binatia bacterium]|nr:hypothetical protein [Candidatus Binatia bacterium]
MPPPPPQLATIHRLVDEVPPPAGELLERGRQVFLAGEARPTLVAARPYPAGLICESSTEAAKPCRARRPSTLPPADHAILAFGYASGPRSKPMAAGDAVTGAG